MTDDEARRLRADVDRLEAQVRGLRDDLARALARLEDLELR